LKKTTIRPLTTPADLARSEAAAAAPEDKPARASFGRGHQASPPADPDELDFNALHGGGHSSAQSTTQAPRGMIPVFIVTIIGILLGAVYFINTMLAFKNAMLGNQTSVLGPYPSYAVAFVIIPALLGPFYFLMDYLGGRTGVPPFTSIKGIAATLIIGVLLLQLVRLPVAVIRHTDNNFASQHGYSYCSNVFDPQRLHIYALQSYIAAYGCPTIGPQ